MADRRIMLIGRNKNDIRRRMEDERKSESNEEVNELLSQGTSGKLDLSSSLTLIRDHENFDE